MTCRHQAGDRSCSNHPDNIRKAAETAAAESNRAAAKSALRKAKKQQRDALTPDANNYEVQEFHRVGKHVVIRVLYPNCTLCAYDGNKVNGYHQAKSLPVGTGKPVEFLGSTTGPKYSEQKCSPLQVSWSVRPHCAKVDISSLGDWCRNNVFEEDHAHGVRKLVTNPKLLSKIE